MYALFLVAELPLVAAVRAEREPCKDLIVDACVAGKPPTEAGIAAASQRHAVEMQDQSACCGCVF